VTDADVLDPRDVVELEIVVKKRWLVRQREIDAEGVRELLPGFSPGCDSDAAKLRTVLEVANGSDAGWILAEQDRVALDLTAELERRPAVGRKLVRHPRVRGVLSKEDPRSQFVDLCLERRQISSHAVGRVDRLGWGRQRFAPGVARAEHGRGRECDSHEGIADSPKRGHAMIRSRLSRGVRAQNPTSESA
jgi:hypothetical protein